MHLRKPPFEFGDPLRLFRDHLGKVGQSGQQFVKFLLAHDWFAFRCCSAAACLRVMAALVNIFGSLLRARSARLRHCASVIVLGTFSFAAMPSV